MQAPLLDSCKGYFQALANRPYTHPKTVHPSITISREAGAGAVTIGDMVKEILEKQDRGPIPWTLFDRNLVQKVIEDHALPERLGEYMPEDKTGNVHSIVEEAFGLHPDPSSLVEQTADTIARLASAGNSIIIGRGGNIITSRMHSVLHIRLVAPIESRIRRIRKLHNLTEREAQLYIHNADRGRERYVKHYFDEDIASPLNYHMVLNTGMVPDERAARLIADAVRHLAQ
jgi:hypothetical protein